MKKKNLEMLKYIYAFNGERPETDDFLNINLVVQGKKNMAPENVRFLRRLSLVLHFR